MLARARSKAAAQGLAISLIEADVETLDLPAARYDLIVERHVIWTLPHRGPCSTPGAGCCDLKLPAASSFSVVRRPAENRLFQRHEPEGPNLSPRRGASVSFRPDTQRTVATAERSATAISEASRNQGRPLRRRAFFSCIVYD